MPQSFSTSRADKRSHDASRKLLLIFISAFAIALPSCDTVRTTRQQITMTVKDGMGHPVSNAKVIIKESWESWSSWIPSGNENEKILSRQRWESDFVPWINGITDVNGKVALQFDATAIDSTRGIEPPANRDWVSNREYLVKIHTQETDDELAVAMKPGLSNKGKVYTVKVEEVSMPQYTKTKKR